MRNGNSSYSYMFDPIGNRLTATNNTAVTTYFANELNQYTNVVRGVSITPTHDDDGNMGHWGQPLRMDFTGGN